MNAKISPAEPTQHAIIPKGHIAVHVTVDLLGMDYSV